MLLNVCHVEHHQVAFWPVVPGYRTTFEKAVLKRRSGIVALALAALLASLAPGLHALTMGEPRGAVVIGRPLDVSVLVQAASGDDLAASCFAANVFNADARQSKPKVSVTSTTAESAVVRIESAGAVDEPVVSVELSFNCGFFVTRRYVLLTDIEPADVAPSTAAVASVVRLAAPEQGGLVSGRPTLSPPGESAPAKPSPVAQRKPLVPAQARKAQAGVTKPKAPASAQASAQAVKPVVSPKASEPATGKAVLKLAPLEDFSARIGALESAKLAAPAAEVLQQTQQIASLQADIKALRDIATKSDAQLLVLKAQLELARSQQISLAWIYALGLLVLACLAALVWLVWQQRRAQVAPQPKWHDSRQRVAPEPTEVASPTESALPTPPMAVASAVVPAANRPPARSPVAVDINPELLEPAPKVAPDPPPPTLANGPAGLHSFSVESILDIRQQAEFFVSLGQTERALEILKKQVASSSEPNPFIYLDLLALFHSMGLKTDFREYRGTFNRFFTGVMPDFPAFHLEGQDLLAYPQVLERLVQGWPSAQTLVLLGSYIFRSEKVLAHASFDLAAFRDLLMLHALAEAVATDLPWDTLSPEFQPDRLMSSRGESSVLTPEALKPADAGRPAPSVRLPEAPHEQSLDMDFSAFETGPSLLEQVPSPATAKVSPGMLPPMDSPRAHWEKTGKSS